VRLTGTGVVGQRKSNCRTGTQNGVSLRKGRLRSTAGRGQEGPRQLVFQGEAVSRIKGGRSGKGQTSACEVSWKREENRSELVGSAVSARKGAVFIVGSEIRRRTESAKHQFHSVERNIPEPPTYHCVRRGTKGQGGGKLGPPPSSSRGEGLLGVGQFDPKKDEGGSDGPPRGRETCSGGTQRKRCERGPREHRV